MSLRERTRPGLGIIEPCLPSPVVRIGQELLLIGHDLRQSVRRD